MTSSRNCTQKATGFIYLVPLICNGTKPSFQGKTRFQDSMWKYLFLASVNRGREAV